MNFGEALQKVKLGKKIARKSWNGKNQFVFMVDGDSLNDAVGHANIGDWSDCSDVLAIYTSNKVVQVGWLATQTDMLANDWYVVK